MQVLTNLLSNAAKFSPPQSEVTVAAERRGAEVRVSVCDHGPGIPQEFRERIFQRFAQADSSSTRQREGTGLGLSISKAIIERMNGRIGFETQEGVGTTFFIDLPAVDATGPAGEG
jgi:signal transduction histidine kinase